MGSESRHLQGSQKEVQWPAGSIQYVSIIFFLLNHSMFYSAFLLCLNALSIHFINSLRLCKVTGNFLIIVEKLL